MLLAGASAIATDASAPSTAAAPDVRDCRFVPGASVASMPPDLLATPEPTSAPSPAPFQPTSVDPSTTARQLETLEALWAAVRDHYLDPTFGGLDWPAVGDRYRAVVEAGIDDATFHRAMAAMVKELGDDHSYIQTPTEVREEADAIAGQLDFVGVGALFLPITGTDAATVVVVFPGGPAADAGLAPHDSLLAVDGGPIRDEHGISRTRGPAGTTVVLTVQRPGAGGPHDITLTRARVSGGMPIEACLVPGTRVGYLLLPTFLDETIDDQAREAIGRMASAGPLDALVLDLRLNGGGLGSVATAILSLFLDGSHGAFVSRDGRSELRLRGEDVGGSQAVDLAVLVGPDTVSFGEVVAGVLHAAGRATIIGLPTLGNVEELHRFDLPDGSRAWLAAAAFEPEGGTAGEWEVSGIVPDIVVPTRWDLFTEADDPALARALEAFGA
jgi:carboxyl-terminal processing protease